MPRRQTYPLCLFVRHVFCEPKLPDYVVLVSTVEEVQGSCACNQEKIPVVPYTAGTNIGGLTIPERGGIIMDLKRMNQIIKIDNRIPLRGHRAGVSHAQLATALYPHKLRFGWPVGRPPLRLFLRHLPRDRGLNARYGLNSQEITSMEVVLPTGELVRVAPAPSTPRPGTACCPCPDGRPVQRLAGVHGCGHQAGHYGPSHPAGAQGLHPSPVAM